jgi:hypothetical protein
VLLQWNETTDKWQFTNDGSTYYDIADAARLDSSFTHANGAFDKANTATTTADAAFSKANSANVLAQAGFDTANTATTTAQNAYNLANGTAGIANTDVTNISTTAGVYGDSTIIPVITLAANGRVSSITNTAITGFATIGDTLALSIALG